MNLSPFIKRNKVDMFETAQELPLRSVPKFAGPTNCQLARKPRAAVVCFK